MMIIEVKNFAAQALFPSEVGGCFLKNSAASFLALELLFFCSSLARLNIGSLFVIWSKQSEKDLRALA